MIDHYTLEQLLKKYNVNPDKIVTKNNNILKYGEYLEIDNTLNYLINELKVDFKSIEKCPSILYRNVIAIRRNVKFLKSKKINFANIKTCLHVLSTDSLQLEDTYDYIEKNYGLSYINAISSILSVPVSKIIEVEKLDLNFIDKHDILSISIGTNDIEDVKDIINSEEFKKYPKLFTATTLSHAKIDDIKDMINSEEFRKHPKLFTATTLSHAKIDDIKDIINSEEFKKYPELFTSQTLVHAKAKDIKDIINSGEFKMYPWLFTSETLAHAKIDDIKDMINSEEFKKYPELFTSQTLAHTKIKDIKDMINSEEFKKYPELFTSTTLARAKLEDIKDIINSEEFKKYPELFTSQTLAHAKIDDIRKLLALKYWQDEKYQRLLTASIVANSKKMLEKLPLLIEMAEYYGISQFLNTSYLRKSPSQNYALINYLLDLGIELIYEDKLNPLFSYAPIGLKKKYNIDLNELIQKYPYNKDKIKTSLNKGRCLK